MDIGSSTGGFTDCSLRNGAKRVVAIDVGTDLMANSLRNDERVELHEQLNFKNATSNLFEGIDLIVSDVSFISLKHIIDRISLEDEDFELVFLIKPQFECGKEIADKFKGIINDKEVHKDVILDIIAYFKKYGYNIIDLDVSKIQGKSGNIEYLAHFKRTEDATNIDIETIEQFTQIPNIAMDKDDDGHYDAVSAFQKSIRGSDVDAALYYLARLCEAEDLISIERRLLVIAYEDIGLGNPSAVDRTFNAIETA